MALFCLLSFMQCCLRVHAIVAFSCVVHIFLLSRFPLHAIFHHLFIYSKVDGPIWSYCTHCSWEHSCARILAHTCMHSEGSEWEGIFESQSMLIFSFTKNCQTVLQRGCNSLHSQWQSMGIPFDPQTHRPLPIWWAGMGIFISTCLELLSWLTCRVVPKNLLHKTPLGLWITSDLSQCLNIFQGSILGGLLLKCVWTTPTLIIFFSL